MKTYISKEDAVKIAREVAGMNGSSDAYPYLNERQLTSAINLAIAMVIGEPVGTFMSGAKIMTDSGEEYRPLNWQTMDVKRFKELEFKLGIVPLYAIKPVGNEFPCETFAPERNTK